MTSAGGVGVLLFAGAPGSCCIHHNAWVLLALTFPRVFAQGLLGSGHRSLRDGCIWCSFGGGVPVEGAEVLSPSMAQWSRHWGWLVKLSLPCFPLQSWGRLSASSSTEGFAPRVSAAKGQGWDWHRPERSWGCQGAGWDPSLLHDQPKSVAGCSVVSGLASFGPKC